MEPPRRAVLAAGTRGGAIRIDGAGLLQAARRAWAPALLGALPVLLTVLFLVAAHRSGVLADDFERSVWQAGRDVLSGRSPYGLPSRVDPLLGDRALYPPLFVFATIPFALLPQALAAVVWALFLAAAVGAGLWLLGVRDWRCYGIAALSWPVILGLTYGNVSLALVLALAALWRFRDSLLGSAALGALIVAVKLFLWPLLVWLFLTRRLRAGSLALAGSAVAIVVPWAVIGFAGLRDYPALLDIHTDVWGSHSLSLYALARSLGFGSVPAQGLGVLVALLLLGLAAMVARKPDGDRRSFALAIAAALAASPIVWQHYLVLLVVPIALVQPKLGRLWALLPAFWLVLLHPGGEEVSNGWERLVVLSVVSALLVLIVRREVRGPGPLPA